MLLYYVSSPHNSSATPRRCTRSRLRAESGVDECACRYGAQVRHADESLPRFQDGLAQARLAGATLQMITADHARPSGHDHAGSDISGEWKRIDEFHGFTCHRRKRTSRCRPGPRYRACDIGAPRVQPRHHADHGRVIGLPRHQPHGRRAAALLRSDSARSASRPLVSYGYCSHAVSDGGASSSGGRATAAAGARWRRAGDELRQRAVGRPAARGHRAVEYGAAAGPMASHARWLSSGCPRGGHPRRSRCAPGTLR